VTFNILTKGKILNHNLVSTFLSDAFGIQVRSGCFCAGPFGISLLGLTEERIDELENQVSLGIMVNKPGYCRIDIPFYFHDFEI